jgi:hypothetical protein
VGNFITFVIIAVGAILIERYRATTRRPRVERYLAENGMTLLDCRYSFQFLRWNWNTWFRIRAVDADGRERSGLAAATGGIRDKAWVEWDRGGKW